MDITLDRSARSDVAERTTSISSSHLITAAIGAVPFILAVIGIRTGLAGYRAWFSDEDGLAENLQFAFLVLGTFGAGYVAHARWRRGERLLALLYVGLAFALFFVAGEEVSWGQRELDIATPPEWASHNIQGEITLHNTYLFTPIFSLAQLVLGLGVALAALTPWHRFLPPRWDRLRELLVPGPALASYFLMSAAWRAYRYTFVTPQTPAWIGELSEVPELILYLGLLLFVADQVRRVRRTAATRPIPAHAR
jgi:hypothetical protein